MSSRPVIQMRRRDLGGCLPVVEGETNSFLPPELPDVKTTEAAPAGSIAEVSMVSPEITAEPLAITAIRSITDPKSSGRAHYLWTFDRALAHGVCDSPKGKRLVRCLETPDPGRVVSASRACPGIFTRRFCL